MSSLVPLTHTRLLSSTTNTRITNNANGKTGSQTRNTDRQTGAHINETPKYEKKGDAM